MKPILVIMSLSLVSGILNPSAFGQATDRDVTRDSKYIIYSEPEDMQLGASLFRVLIGADKNIRLAKAESIDKAIESDANVIVLVSTRRIRRDGVFNWKLDKESLDSLKKRKIIGIGIGASQLFEDLGLEIHGGQCAHFTRQIPSLDIVPNELVNREPDATSIEVLEDPSSYRVDPAKPTVFAMHLPRTSDEVRFVEAVARFSLDANYAPIVRQGNYLLIGIPIQVSEWSQEYEQLMREVLMNFHARHPEDFEVIEKELVKPGKHAVDLATRGSTEKPYSKIFYFRFDQPTVLSFELTGPNPGTMMMFRGGDGADTIRLDARDKASLQIDVEISQQDIQAAGPKYWELTIVNFGAEPVSCELDISRNSDGKP